MGIQPFAYLSPVDGHLDCFYFLAVVNNVAMNIGIEVFVWTYAFISLGYILRCGIDGHNSF